MTDIVKLCVGCPSIAVLKRELQREWDERAEDGPFRIWAHTRNGPKQADEIVAGGGSLYWVIQGVIACRQRITGFDFTRKDTGEPLCRIGLDLTVVPTEAWPMRAFQGWRYLPPDRRPPDAADWVGDAPPEEMARELRALGLI
jgi:hypothetical protein